MQRILVETLAAATAIWLIGSFATAVYGIRLGYPALPTIACAFFMPWPVVLLALVLRAGPREVAVRPRRAATPAPAGPVGERIRIPRNV